MSPFFCVRLLLCRSFGGCGCVLAKVAMVAAVLVADAVIFFFFDCLVVVLEAVDLAVVGLRFHELFGESLGGVLLILAASISVDVSSIM